jgi:hypothetical protein
MSNPSQQEQFSYILSLIRQGYWSDAQKAMAELDCSDFQANRMIRYFEGKHKLVLHQYDEAIRIFIQAKAEFGEHLLLLADLATAYYLTQRYGLWKKSVEQLLHCFDQESKVYEGSISDRLKILVAKFLEEAGDLVTAEKFLISTLESSNPMMVRRAQTHLLRLWAQYQMGDKILLNYQNLKSVNPLKEDHEYYFEHYHALALAEAELSTPALAAKSLLALTEIDPISQSLIGYDLAEIELRRQGQLSDSLRCLVEQTSPSHLYEEKLQGLFRGESPSDWYQWASQMPLGNYLRLLSLLMAAPQFQEQELAFHQWSLVVSSMTKRNQITWNKLLPDQKVFMRIPEVQLTEEGILQINQVSIDLSSKPLLVEFLKILLREQLIEDHVICRELWQTETNESYLARLRQLTTRINKLALKNAAPQICSYHRGTLQIHARG